MKTHIARLFLLLFVGLSFVACGSDKTTPPDNSPTIINIAAIAGVTAPVRGDVPVTSITETAQYTGTVTTWSPAVSGEFAAKTVYTATITLAPKTGFTLQGVAANFFTVAGAATATNAANSGVVIAAFPATDAEPIENEYEAPEGISIDVYDGDTLMTTITTDVFNEIQQEIVISNNRNYVAYAISDVLEYLGCTLSEFTKIVYDTTDNRPATRNSDSFDNAYIAIGYYMEAGDDLNTSGAPRVLPEGADTSSGGVIQYVKGITVNPVEGEEPDEPGEPGEPENEYDVPENFSIDVFDGKWLIGAITAEVLNGIQQEVVTTTDNGRNYVAYAVTDVLAHLEEIELLRFDLSAFSKIVYDTTDNHPATRESTSFDDAYIAIGYYTTPGGSLTTSGVPRVLPEGAATTNGSVVQNVARITVNPLDDLDNEYVLPVLTNDTVEIYEGDTLVASFTTDDLEEMQQKLVRTVTARSMGGNDDRVYAAYSISDILAYIDYTPPAFTQIRYHASDGYGDGNPPLDKTSFDRAYVAIGYYTYGTSSESLNYGGALRVIVDSNAKTSDQILQSVVRITVNPTW